MSKRSPNPARTRRLQSRVRFHYTAEVLEELRKHGVVPTGDTDPQLVRDFLSALYR